MIAVVTMTTTVTAARPRQYGRDNHANRDNNHNDDCDNSNGSDSRACEQ
jgi:hypothetical protein